MKNRTRLCVTALTVFFVLAAVWSVLAEKPGGKGGGGGKGGKNTQLCLTFRDFLGDDILPPDAIQNDVYDLDEDGETDPYCDGVDKVGVSLNNRYGHFTFQSSDTGEQIRQVWIDATDSIDCPEEVILPMGFYGVYIATDRNIDLRTLTPGVEYHISLRIRFDTIDVFKDGDIWEMVFGDDFPAFPCDIDNPVTLTAMDEDGDTVNDAWTIEAFPGDVACLFHNDDMCHVYAPFRMTVWQSN